MPCFLRRLRNMLIPLNKLSGDVHPNPGPSQAGIKFAGGEFQKSVRGNQDAILCAASDHGSHARCKSKHLRVLRSICGFDIIAIKEKHLDSSISTLLDSVLQYFDVSVATKYHQSSETRIVHTQVHLKCI